MTREELIIGFFEKGYCCDLDEVKDTCLGLLKENQEQKKVIDKVKKFIHAMPYCNDYLDTILEDYTCWHGFFLDISEHVL